MEASLGMAIVDDLAISGHAYYVGEREAGLRACERILSSEVDPETEARARRNRIWYTPTLSSLLGQAGFARVQVRPARPGWSTFNPTVAADGPGRLLIVVRSSNYRIVADGSYVMPPEDEGRILTRSLVYRWTLGTPPGEAEMLLGPGYETNGNRIEGMEDLRLYPTADGWGVSGTVLDAAGFDGTCRIGTAALLPDAALLCDFRMREEPVPGRHEKNWMPVVGLGSPEWVYSCWEDGRTALVSAVGDRWVVRSGPTAPLIARGFRGGSQAIEWIDGSFLAVVHEVATDRGRRIYEHRFVRFDQRFRITGISDPFVFNNQRAIEFCAGAALVVDELGYRKLALSFGEHDATASIALCDPLLVDRAIREV